MKIELDNEQVDEVIRQWLNDLLTDFEDNLAAHRDGRGISLFSIDPAEDAKIIKKHIKACKRLFKYCGESVE